LGLVDGFRRRKEETGKEKRGWEEQTSAEGKYVSLEDIGRGAEMIAFPQHHITRSEHG
jgi:hypothetical protein